MSHAISVRELRNHTADVVRRVEAGEVLQVTVYGRPAMELRPIVSRSWLDELAAEPPTDSGLSGWLEDQREADMALDWGPA